jgi:hypothetical protein
MRLRADSRRGDGVLDVGTVTAGASVPSGTIITVTDAAVDPLGAAVAITDAPKCSWGSGKAYATRYGHVGPRWGFYSSPFCPPRAGGQENNTNRECAHRSRRVDASPSGKNADNNSGVTISARRNLRNNLVQI